MQLFTQRSYNILSDQKRASSLLIPKGKYAYIILRLKSQNMKHLTLEQRYELQTMRASGMLLSTIAAKLEVHKSTISRELDRNSVSRSTIYKAELAQRKCDTRHKSKPKHIRFTAKVKLQVDKYLKLDYSPEQITGYLKTIGLDCVSHERIYQLCVERKTQWRVAL